MGMDPRARHPSASHGCHCGKVTHPRTQAKVARAQAPPQPTPCPQPQPSHAWASGRPGCSAADWVLSALPRFRSYPPGLNRSGVSRLTVNPLPSCSKEEGKREAGSATWLLSEDSTQLSLARHLPGGDSVVSSGTPARTHRTVSPPLPTGAPCKGPSTVGGEEAA